MKIKVSQPMFEVGELERFDNNIHSIVEEYSKLMFKEKDQILTQRIIMKQEEEIERLNKIISKVADYLKDNPKLINDKLYKNDQDTSFVFINTKIKLDLLDILEGE